MGSQAYLPSPMKLDHYRLTVSSICPQTDGQTDRQTDNRDFAHLCMVGAQHNPPTEGKGNE